MYVAETRFELIRVLCLELHGHKRCRIRVKAFSLTFPWQHFFGDCGSADISLGGTAGLIFLTLSSFLMRLPYGTSGSSTEAEEVVWHQSKANG